MRPLMCFVLFAAASAAACLDAPHTGDEPPLGEDIAPITADECTTLGNRNRWPEACPAAVTEKWCRAQTWDEATAWDARKPICLGFSTDIANCTNCNKLNLTGRPNRWSLGWNRAFIECAQNRWLPGQTRDNLGFVTQAAALTAPRAWPDTGQVTAREMCTLGVPSEAAVTAFRTTAMCRNARETTEISELELWTPDGMGGCIQCADEACGDAPERFPSESECQAAVDAFDSCPYIPDDEAEVPAEPDAEPDLAKAI